MSTTSLTIDIAFRPGPTLSIHDMHEFQDDLKELDEKAADGLEQEILQTGFAFPPYVWRDMDDGRWKIIDAHGRKKVLLRMEQKGYTIPRLETVEVLARSREEAKRRVLQASSQYQRMTDQGLANFSKGADINFEALGNFRFPEVKLTSVQTHLRALNPTDKKDDGLQPELPQYIVAVTCIDEVQMQLIYDEMTRRGMPCKLIT